MKAIRVLICIFGVVFTNAAFASQETELQYDVVFSVGGRAVDYYQVDDTNATLDIIATNIQPHPDKNPIYIKAIAFTIPVGTEARDLVSSGTGIAPIAITDGWNISLSGTTVIATPKTPEKGKVAGTALQFVLKNLTINSEIGSAPIGVKEIATDGSSRETIIPIGKYPKDFYLNGPYASPTTVDRGESTTISWSGTPTASYELEYDGQSHSAHPDGEPFKSTDSYVAEDLQHSPTTFTLTVKLENPGFDPLMLQKQIDVTVQGDGNHFTANIDRIFKGESIELQWNTIDAITGEITDDQGNPVYSIPQADLESGKTTVQIPENRYFITYKLTIKNHSHESLTLDTNSIHIITLSKIKEFEVGKVYKIAITPDGKFAYCASNTENVIYIIDLNKIDLSDNKIRTRYEPIDAAISPKSGKYVYIYGKSPQNNRITILDQKTNKLFKQIDTPTTKFTVPLPIAIDPNEDYMYLCIPDQNKIEIYDTSSFEIENTIEVKENPKTIIISPDGKSAYIAHQNDAISAVDLATRKATTLNVSVSELLCLEISPDNSKLYVGGESGIISVVNTGDNKVSTFSISDEDIRGIAITPDGRYVYASTSKEIHVIDTSLNKKVNSIEFGKKLFRMAISPSGNYLFVSDPGAGKVYVFAI